MESLSFCLFSISYFSFLLLAYSSPNCPVSYCSSNGPTIHFPFYLLGLGPARNPCGYPGFSLSCSNNQTVLRLPNAGQFLLTRIDYSRQYIYLNDPAKCLASRVMKNISLSYWPFEPVFSKKFTFFNCSHDVSVYPPYRVKGVRCLNRYNNTSNYTVVVAPDDYNLPFHCESNWSVSVPVDNFVYRYDVWADLTEDIMLTWRKPVCGDCEAKGGICGFRSESSMKIKCFGVQNNGLSSSARYGLTIAFGVPGVMCLIGFIFYTCKKHQNTDLEVRNPSITHQSAHILTGLDGSTINSYPKTVLGDSGRLPKPNDSTCSICLAEYLPKETLRCIPECNHYFHANCIDEWLKMNSTCPLCRNTPNGSSVATPATSVSLTSSSSTSSP